MGNVGGWIQDIRRRGGKKSRWFTNTPFQITVLQTAMWGRKRTLLHQLHWIPHHADTLRLWRERVSLLSAKQLLQNSAKPFRLNTGEISALGYRHSYRLRRRKKANHHQKKEPETMEFIWHRAIRQRKSSAFAIKQILSPHHGALRGLKPSYWHEEPWAPAGAPCFPGSGLCEHAANKQEATSPSFQGHRQAFISTPGFC